MNTSEPNFTPQARVLVIEDDESEFEIVRQFLQDRAPLFELRWAPTLSAGLDLLSEHPVDVILLDLFLPDSQGLETFTRVKARAMDAPVVILSGLDDEMSSFEAIKKGAQDYLVKGQADAVRLSRVLQYAMKRNELQKDPKNSPLVDPLTGLSNREGFAAMAEHHLKLAKRMNRGLVVCFAVVDGLAQIAQNFGEEEGNRAVTTAAEILRESFRPSDTVARLVPDGFAIMTGEQNEALPPVVSARIRNNEKYYNAQFNRYPLSLSMCTSRIASSQLNSARDLITRADKIFREYRRQRKSSAAFVGV
jgi:diguanylate cyclase (GGDEF)-like protein